MTTQENIDSFHRFASRMTVDGTSPLSLEELVEQWRHEARSARVRAEDMAGIRAALEDMRNGERGEPADEVVRQLRDELDMVGRE